MAKKHSRAPDGVKVLGEKRHPPNEVSGPDPTLIADIEASRVHVRFSNVGGVTMYIGKHTLDDPAVVLSPANGIPLLAGGLFEDDSSYDQWWAITANGALGQVVVMETLAKSVPAPVIPQSYSAKVAATFPIAYWIMGESGGLIAHDSMNSPAQDGTYQGVTLGQPGIGDGKTCPLFDGVNNFVNITTPNFQAAFNGAEGTLQMWWLHDAAAHNDLTLRRMLVLSNGAFTSFLIVAKTGTNSNLQTDFRAGGVPEAFGLIVPILRPVFSVLHLTWSAIADLVTYYDNGVPVGTDVGLGVWAGPTVINVIGASNTVPANPYWGNLAHVSIWDRPLTPAEVADLAVL